MNALVDFIETLMLVGFSFVFGAIACACLITGVVRDKAPDIYPKYNEIFFEGVKE